MSGKELTKRYIVFIMGLFISSLGVSLVTKAKLGTSPISSIPYVLSLGFHPTLGQFTIYFSLFLIVLQMGILKKEFKKSHLLQIPVSIAFGYFIDVTMIMLNWLQPEAYILKCVSLLIGCVVLAFGVYLEVAANVVMLPGESFVKAVTVRFHTDFGITKVCFDASMAIVAGIASIVMFHALNGVREGTVVAALIVGLIARFFGKKLSGLTKWMFPVDEETVETEEVYETDHSQKHVVVTISREYGSGGCEIGKMLAKKLQIPYYDKELIQMTAINSGYTEEFIKNHEQKLTNSLLYDLYASTFATANGEQTAYDAIYKAEEKVIRELALEKSCVIVGRLADFILKDQKNTYNIFIHANEKYKIRTICRQDGLTEVQAASRIKKVDTERKNHYKYFTNHIWGMSANYHLTMDNSLIGKQGCVDMILKLLEHNSDNEEAANLQ